MYSACSCRPSKRSMVPKTLEELETAPVHGVCGLQKKQAAEVQLIFRLPRSAACRLSDFQFSLRKVL